MLKWGLPGGGVKSAKVAPTPYVYYPPMDGILYLECELTVQLFPFPVSARAMRREKIDCTVKFKVRGIPGEFFGMARSLTKDTKPTLNS